VTRCFGDGDPLYEAYHDDEWGHPVTDERGLFERVSLEAFQSGLSWITILRKRDAFRAAFADFEPDAIARFGAEDVERLLGDAGIVRNRAKIEATVRPRGPRRRASPTSRPRFPRRRRWPRRSRRPAFASSARRRSTPGCRPAGWSTTTSRRARSASASRRSKRLSRADLGAPLSLQNSAFSN
jgi:DNA-3-methyladenine glycosylase I